MEEELMARQPIQDLQGFGQTSVSSARPIDAFTGAPAIPQETPGSQLADALGAFSGATARASARNAAQAKAEKAELDKKKATGYATRFKGEEGEFLDSVKLGETYADLSEVVVSTIVEDKYKNEYYTATYDKLRGLDDDVKGDVVALETMFDDLVSQSAAATDGMDFVQSGAVMGTRNAINEMRREFSVFRDQKTRELAKTNTTANVFSFLDKSDLSTKDGQTSAITLINAFNDKLIATSPFSKREDKQQIVDSLIEYNKLNPDSNAVVLIQRIPWLQSKETDAKLAIASPQIAQLGISKLRNDTFVKEQEDKQTLADEQAVLNELAENNDIDGIRKVQAKYAGVTGQDAMVSNAIYKAAEIAEASAKVAPDVSAGNYTSYKAGLTLKATKGDTGSLEEELAAIQSLTDITPSDKAALLREAPTLLQGHKIIASDQHTSAFRNRFGAILRAYENNPQLMVKSFELAQQGTSAESIARDAWDDETSRQIQLHIENNDTVPGFNELYGDEGIYAKAELKVTERLQALASMMPQTSQVETQPQQVNYGIKVGTIVTAADGQKAEYLGGDPDVDSNYKVIEEPKTEEQANVVDEVLDLFDKFTD
jgi:hypothetical protein